MAEGAGAGAEQGSSGPPTPGATGGVDPEDWRDWAGGLPAHLLAKIAETHIAQNEAGWAAQLKVYKSWMREEEIQEEMAKRRRDGNCLLVFARVCKHWRKAQLKVGGPLRTRVISDVILPGGLELAKWVLAEGCPREDGYGFTTAHAAARYGQAELVKWLCGEGSSTSVRLDEYEGPFRRFTGFAGYESTNRSLAEGLQGGFAMDEWVMIEAAGSGNLELVRWLRGEGCDWNAWTCMCAAGAGQLRVLQWLRANGCPWDTKTCNFAANAGHLETLRWARENGCDWNESTCAMAAMGGHLQVLQWLRGEGCPWSHLTCSRAVRYGHLELVQWLCGEGGFAMDEDVMARAAASGDLELVRWLRGEGCPWNWRTCYWAVENGHVEVLRWARENGCPWRVYTRDRAAAKLGYTDDLGNVLSIANLLGW